MTDVVHARSRGVPRIINVIRDAALVFGYAEGQRQVDQALVRGVLSELELTGVLPASAPAALAAAQTEIAHGPAPVRMPAVRPEPLRARLKRDTCAAFDWAGS